MTPRTKTKYLNRSERPPLRGRLGPCPLVLGLPELLHGAGLAGARPHLPSASQQAGQIHQKVLLSIYTTKVCVSVECDFLNLNECPGKTSLDLGAAKNRQSVNAK